MKKNLAIVVVLLVVLGFITGAIVWFAPQSGPGKMIMSVVDKFAPKKEKAEDVKGMVVTAESIAKEYAANEKAADTKYLNKVIEVSGAVAEFEKNQDGGLLVVLATGDPAGGIQCAMREKNATVTKGQNLTIKGFCSGNGIMGISLTDCIIK